MIETWKPVIGHASYEVSDLGRVRSVDREWWQTGRGGRPYLHRRRGRVLKPGIASHGYPTVSLGRGNSRTLHSLVAEAFIGPCPNGMEVLHADDDRVNPRLSNLSYGTRLDNVRQMHARGRARNQYAA